MCWVRIAGRRVRWRCITDNTVCRQQPEGDVWAGASCGSGQELLPSGTALEAAVDNKRPLPPIVRESFVMPGPLSSGKPGRDAVSCWRPSWQDPATAESTLQLGAFRVRGEAFSFLTWGGAGPCSRPSGHKQRAGKTGPASQEQAGWLLPGVDLGSHEKASTPCASSRVRFQ